MKRRYGRRPASSSAALHGTRPYVSLAGAADRAAQGALVVADDRLLELDGLAVTPADPRGSGDSMVAAMAVSLAEGRQLEEALRIGAGAGALNATRHGLGTGTRAEIEQISRAVRLAEAEPALGLP